MRILPLRVLPADSPSSAPRLVRHAGIAAPYHSFLLNQEPYRDASILLAGDNVGTGTLTGTEGGLPALGVRVVIAPGFGPVFFSEAVRQGLLLVPSTVAVIERMADWVEANPRVEMTVDLEAQVIEIPGMEPVAFATHPRLRDKLLYGLEDVDELLQHREEAVAFRAADRKKRPWLYNRGVDPAGGEPA